MAFRFTVTSKFYVFAFFDDFMLIYPFYVLLFADRGISAGQIAVLLMAWSVTAFLLEVPSGAIADKYSRRSVMLVAVALRVAAFGVWMAVPTFWGFLVGFVLWGANGALTSGTQEALLYDELAKAGRRRGYAKVLGRVESVGLAGAILSGFAASLLAGLGYGFMLAASIAASVVALAVLASLPRSSPVESTGETRYWSYLRDGVRDAVRAPGVLPVIAVTAVVGGVFGVVDEYYSLLFREKGFDNAAVAFWTAVTGVAAIIGSLLAHRFETRRPPYGLALVGWAGLLLAAVALGGLATPLLLAAFAMTFQIVNVLTATTLHHAITDRTRATTASVAGLLTELVSIAGYAVLAVTTHDDAYGQGLAVLAVTVIAAALTARWYTRPARKPPAQATAPARK